MILIKTRLQIKLIRRIKVMIRIKSMIQIKPTRMIKVVKPVKIRTLTRVKMKLKRKKMKMQRKRKNQNSLDQSQKWQKMVHYMQHVIWEKIGSSHGMPQLISGRNQVVHWMWKLLVLVSLKDNGMVLLLRWDIINGMDVGLWEMLSLMLGIKQLKQILKTICHFLEADWIKCISMTRVK